MTYPLLPDAFPVLEGLDVTLREPSRLDTAAWFRRATDPAVYEMTSEDPPASRDELARALSRMRIEFQRKDRISWMIVPTGETEGAGMIAFNQLSAHDRRGELGFTLGREWWGHGYARRAAELVLQFGFDDLGLNRVDALVMSGNLRSRRLLERLGFREEGLLRQYRMVRGSPRDFWIFGLLEREWRGR